MYVVLGSGPEAPATLVWATKDGVMTAVLEAVPDAAPGASGSPAPSGSGRAELRQALGQALGQAVRPRRAHGAGRRPLHPTA